MRHIAKKTGQTCKAGITKAPPCGPQKATDVIRSTDWELAGIWYATSEDGFHWKEQGPAVTRPAKGQLGWRSNCTPDILIRKGKYYLYCQAYNKVIEGGDSCPVTMVEAESPDGPWFALG